LVVSFIRNRLDELDSLRGLAASSVVISHLILVLPSIFIIEKLSNTPLHLFWGGHESVILFFILSGFVLSFPYLNKKEPKYRYFIIRRVCRIYIPYIVSVLISMFLMHFFNRGGIPELSKWFNGTWNTPLSLKQLLNHFIMLGTFPSYTINPVIWSLVHEMRISIIFPILMVFVMNLNWKK
jgi:peptidoglycan/LPS O-acetylase OafA/YrhL